MCNPHDSGYFFFKAVLVQQLPVCKINTVLLHSETVPTGLSKASVSNYVSVQSAEKGVTDRFLPWDLVLSLKCTFAFDVHHHYAFFSSLLSSFPHSLTSLHLAHLFGLYAAGCCLHVAVSLGSLLHKVRVCVIDQMMTNCSRCKATAVSVDGLMSMHFSDWIISG